jgi:hypothetical protein
MLAAWTVNRWTGSAPIPLDTDHLTLSEHGHPVVVARVDAEPLKAVGVSAVTVEESVRGRLAVLARARDGSARVRGYAQLLGTVQLLSEFVLVPFDQTAEVELAISEIVGRVPGLVLEDWSV